MRLEAPLPYFTGFPKYPYVTHSPSMFGWQPPPYGPAFGAVSPRQKQQAHMVAEALGIAVAAPIMWWASNHTQDVRARRALRALAIAQAVTDAAFLGWNAWDMYQERPA